MHIWIEVHKPEDVADILRPLPHDFRSDGLMATLGQIFSSRVKGVLAEYPYVDRDYRSTFYGYYAKKGRAYNPFCARLHFFGEKVTLASASDLRIETTDSSESYLGYMVLRPTPPTIIGRSVLSPNAVVGVSGKVLTSKHVVHLLGHRLQVEGFPYMEQHTDVSVCAHAACWSILRHFSERHRKYAEFLTYDITELAAKGRAGGMAPSRGLQLDQVCQVFSQAGHYPDIYLRGKKHPEFFRRLYGYVASGLPVFGAMSTRKHAVTVIGHGEIDRSKGFDPVPPERVLYCAEAVERLIVMDDNESPYWSVPINGDARHYGVSEIDAFVVPLPEKVFFPAEQLEEWVESTLFDDPPLLGLNFAVVKQTVPVINYYLTTSASFKRYLRENRTSFPDDLMVALMELAMPQFIWVVDIADLTEWRRGRSNIMFVIDATAGRYDTNPFFVIHDTQTAFINDRAVTKDMGSFAFDGAGLSARSPLSGNLGSF